MAILSPVTNFSAPASTSQISSDKISCSVTSRVILKCPQKFSGRLGHGSGDVFSSGRVLCRGVPLRSNSAGARYVVLGEVCVIQHIMRIDILIICISMDGVIRNSNTQGMIVEFASFGYCGGMVQLLCRNIDNSRVDCQF